MRGLKELEYMDPIFTQQKRCWSTRKRCQYVSPPVCNRWASGVRRQDKTALLGNQATVYSGKVQLVRPLRNACRTELTLGCGGVRTPTEHRKPGQVTYFTIVGGTAKHCVDQYIMCTWFCCATVR